MKIIDHSILGKIQIQKKIGKRNAIIRVINGSGVIVQIPFFCSFRYALELVEKKQKWILRKQALQRQSNSTKSIEIDTIFQFPNKHICFERNSQICKIKIEENAEKCIIQVPDSIDLNTNTVQENLKNICIELFRKEAKLYLPDRVQEIAKKHFISINQIRVKNIRSRWGSCSSKGNLNFSIYLMLLPTKLIDYVIYHELAHIRHRNHSKDFWNHLEMLCPGASKMDKEMKKHTMPFS